MFLVVEDFFWWVPVFFTDGCSANSCDYGVLTRRSDASLAPHLVSIYFLNSAHLVWVFKETSLIRHD